MWSSITLFLLSSDKDSAYVNMLSSNCSREKKHLFDNRKCEGEKKNDFEVS